MSFFFWAGKTRDRFWFDVRDHTRRYRFFYLGLCAVFFAGLLWGIFSGGAAEWLFVENALDYFFRLFNGNFRFFSHFFSRFLSNLQFVLIVSALSLHVFCFPVQLLYILYRGYIFGVASRTIITIFSLTGVVNLIVIIIPMQLCIMFMLFFCCVVGGSRSYLCFARRDYYYFWRSTPEFLKVLLNVMIVSAIICVLECLLIVLVAFPLNRVFL